MFDRDALIAGAGSDTAHANAVDDERGAVGSLLERLWRCDPKIDSEPADDLAPEPRHDGRAPAVYIEQRDLPDVERLTCLGQTVYEKRRPHSSSADDCDLSSHIMKLKPV